MDIRKVKKLIDLLERSNLAEIEIKEGDDSVRISRSSQLLSTSVAAAATHPIIAPQTGVEAIQTSTAPADCVLTNTITSPMVGTFYAAASPASAAFIAVGSVVQKGDVICIIEAMKIMNQIETDRSGTVTEILCKDGDSVEFGQNLVAFA